MAGRFQIHRHQNSDSLHLRLKGVFDEEAALTLMAALNENRGLARKFIVHTATLDRVLDEGAQLFRTSLNSLDRSGVEIIFTGKTAERIVMKGQGIRIIK